MRALLCITALVLAAGYTTASEITDLSGTPQTGDFFEIVVHVDNASEVYVIYTLDSGEPVNESMEHEYGNYTTVIHIPDSATQLRYTVHALMNDGNTTTLSVTKDVIDVTAPKVTDHTAELKTGRTGTIRVNVTDNRGIQNVKATYTFLHSTQHLKTGTLTLQKVSGDPYTYSASVEVPLNATSMMFTVQAVDVNGIEMNLTLTDNVEDVAPPSIIEDSSSGSGKSGSMYIFDISADDNIEVADVTVEFWYGKGESNQLTLSRSQSGRFTGTLILSDEGDMHYRVTVTDSSGNSVASDVKTVHIKGTGPEDSTMFLGVALVALVALAALLYLQHRKKKRDTGD